MKLMKRLATLILTICLIIPCFSMVSFAANRISFVDPSTAVGETLTLRAAIEADKNIGNRTVNMTYDPSMLRFEKGDHVEKVEDGKLTYSVQGQQDTKKVVFNMTFIALKEGTTKIEINSCEVYATDNTKVTCTEGSSTIKIAAGDSSKIPEETTTDDTSVVVDVDGVSYTFSQNFKESDIPKGFETSTMEYIGEEYKVVSHPEMGLKLAYLVKDGAGDFFLFVEENATFVPFKCVSISDSTDIVLLTYIENLVIPASYIEKTVEMGGFSFPAWQGEDQTETCVLYAMNNRGEKAFYQYDTVEGTYQRFEFPEEVAQSDETMIEKLNVTLGEHLDWVVLGVALGLVIFLIVIIVLSVKLYNRNAELDELYDEYGIDLFGDEEEETVVRIEEMDDEETDCETEDDIVITVLDEEEETDEEATEDSEEDVIEDEEDVEGTTEEEESLEEKKSPVSETMEEAMRTLAEAVKSDEDFWGDDDDDDDSSFDISFIDLDD